MASEGLSKVIVRATARPDFVTDHDKRQGSNASSFMGRKQLLKMPKAWN
jgi:hypothetical protein